MSQGVTYADLRFVRSPLEKSQPKGSDPPQGSPPKGLLAPSALPEASSDGELTYENIQGPGEKTLSSSKGTPPESDHRMRYAAVALLGTCLFLLATTIGLGIRAWQVSRQLRQASREHVAESGILAQRIEAKEGSLAQTQLQLDQAEAELSSTRLALRESWEAGNRTLEQLQLREESLRQVNGSLARVSRGREADLRQATSCQQRGCCLHGWQLFRWKCLWISSSQESWANSKTNCKHKQSRLLILKPWSARELWDAVLVNITKNDPQSNGYWIGLKKTKYILVWDDGFRYEGTEQPLHNSYGNFIKIHNGALEYDWLPSEQQYICEKMASSTQPS